MIVYLAGNGCYAEDLLTKELLGEYHECGGVLLSYFYTSCTKRRIDNMKKTTRPRRCARRKK